MPVDRFMERLVRDNPGEPRFHQAVREVVESVMPLVQSTRRYEEARVLERIVEPERVIIFRVPWVDERGRVQVNRGYRVEMSSALGPYKGGLRFQPGVDLGTFKFLGFEQVFKNSLTTLPLGAGKGGADFDARGRSDLDVMRFCQAFMSELFRHIGPQTDVPAGDVGVGSREIGYLFGQYKKLANEFTGVLTGKRPGWGGSQMRPEATGYGVAYFAEAMLERAGDGLEGSRVAISGSGNVAQFACEKVLACKGKVVTMSDSSGTIVDDDGLDREKLSFVMELKNERRGRIREYAERFPRARYLDGQRPWGVPCDVALPCAIENEIELEDARALVNNGVRCVAEGANMPTVPEAVDLFGEAKVLFGPGKAANAGGVATSGFEMAQNATHLNWSHEEVDGRLRHVMKCIHDACVEHGSERGFVDYVKGANVAGFIRVAEAMLDQGVV